MRSLRPLVVLPTYDEAGNIAEVLGRVRAACPEAHVLVVDDASPDGTAGRAEALGAGLGGVDVLRRPRKAGLGSAYREGFAWGLARGFDALVEMDADLSHQPEALPLLLGALGGGVDLVIGSRYVPGGSIPNWAWHRRALSLAGNVYAAAVLGLPVRDLTSGFRAYSGAVLAGMDLSRVRADGYGFQIEMVRAVAAAGARVVEVPITFVDRVRGRSKMSSRTIFEALALVTWWGLKGGTRRRSARRSAPPPAGAPGPAHPRWRSTEGSEVGS
ncbi:MAG: polyprenol monophosphomannose synthase [Acidimicrobiales bacterium]